MDNAISIKEAYREKSLSYRLTESRIGCIVALILVPAGISLDYIVYPDHFEKFFLLRIICDFAIALIYALHFTRASKKYIKLLTFMWLTSIQVMICYMVYIGGGYDSTYYAGLNLTVLAVGILLPTSVFEALLFFFVTILLYLTACFYDQSRSISFDVLYNNLYFLCLTGVISVAAVYFNTRRRFKEFSLSYELDCRHKELAELDRQKSLFFANISHELRTPLTLILAPLHDLLKGKFALSDQATDLLKVARSNALRLLNLVNDLLDVIRLEEGKLDLKMQPLDLTNLLSGLLKSMMHLARHEDKILTGKLGMQALVVKGDQYALEKIFLNLIGNAIKFTERGGEVLVAGYKSNDMVVIEIRDTGIGIDASDLPYVFDRFRQVDGSATRRYQGTGLGLALVKELTERQGGHVNIQSQPGEGTVVTVSLPASNDAPVKLISNDDYSTVLPVGMPTVTSNALSACAAPASNLKALNQTAINKQISHPCVLVVDDEPDMRHYIVNMLSENYQILQAGDGKQGLEIAQRDLPDLILLDMMLPEINGLEICRRLKQDSATNHIKVVLLTARADESSKLTALDNGADDFLTKPFSSVEVMVRLENLLRTASLQKDLQLRNQDLQNTLQELKDTQSQLVQSEKLNALGTLSAGLLHELNNPLNYSMTAIQLALNEPEVQKDELLLDTMQDIDEGMQRIKTIITDLRAFAYPSELGSMQRFDFAITLQSALRYTSHDMRSIKVEQSLSKDAWVSCSQTHVTQLVVNLLLNAVSAISQVVPPRSGEIKVSSDLKDNRLWVTIRDNGCGMSEDMMSHIFEPFYTTRDVGQGMGLGLSVCHTIINNYGGALAVDSEEGEWTEFTFDLPLATN